ncbi:MAG: FG-GAP-like repeat-containing protein [Archangium sp.]|nr:FG-GAP-like repeat-containing protein [Archangium sp.]
MVSGNVMRWACAIAGVVTVVSGCDCPGPNPPVNCSDTTITFETPTSGMTVDSPFEVSINVKNADGSAFPIDGAQLKVSGGAAIDGTVSGNRATFAGVPGSAGAQSLVATIASGTCSKSSSAQTITVRDACSTAAVTAVSFPQDTGAPLGVLNRAELPPGTNLQAKVDARCVSDAQVRIMRGTTVVGALTDFTNGTVTVTLPTLPDADSARYELFAELVRGTTALNTAASNPQAAAMIEVRRALPACSVITMGSFGPSDDADTSTAGFQMRVTGTMELTSSGSLAINGQTPVAVVPSMTGDVSADFTITASGNYTATVTCTDGNGNTNTSTGAFSVNFDPPTLTIVSPMTVDGGATMVVTQSPLQVQIATNAANGSVVEVSQGASSSTGTVSGGMATVPVSFGADGTYTIQVRVRDLAGNETTVSFTVTVSLTGCGALFTRPGACPALLTPAQLSAGSYSFQTTSRAVCANQPASLYKSSVQADGGVGAPVLAGTSTLAAGGIAGFSPVPFVSGDYVLRADVSNIGVDAGVSTVSCHVTVDLDGPAITTPVVPGGQMFATLNLGQDSQVSTPGVQRSFSFSARVPQGGQVDVCTTQAVDPATGTPRTPSASCSAGGAGWFPLQQGVISPVPAFTFPEGRYQIKIVVVGGGLAVPPESAPVNILSDATLPCVTASSRRLPQDTNADGLLNIAELNGQPPVIEFQLGCGDTSPATLAVNPVTIRDIVTGAPAGGRAGTATFAAGRYTVTFAPAAANLALNLFVELTDQAGNRNTFVSPDPGNFMFEVDPLAPSCDIQSPAASVTLVGQAGAPGGMFPVTVATSSDVATNGVSLSFGAGAAQPVTPSSGLAQASFAVTGTNSYAIAATCTDRAGNATTASTRNVTIDLDPPTCAFTSPQSTTYAANPIATTLTVGGAEGRSVTVRTSLQGAPLSSSLTVAGGTTTANLSYPNGTQTVTAEVTDLAGNLCTATVANVIVNTSGCGLLLTNAITNMAGTWFNRSNTGSLTATAGTIAAVTANSADCRAGQAVTLQRTLPGAGPVLNATTAANGDISFANVAVNDGETWTMTINNGTGILTPQSFRVGLLVPSGGAVTVNANTVTSGQNVFFVANSGNINLDPADGPIKATTYFADQNANVTDGAQVTIGVGPVAQSRSGGSDGRLEILVGASVVLSQAITAEPFTYPPTQLTVPHNLTGNFVVRVTSAAGNTFDVVNNPAVVDVQPPGVPTVGAPTLTSSRAATLTLSWPAVFDDAQAMAGALTGGPVAQLAGYDVRWTTDLVTNNTGIPDTTTYFTRTLVQPDTVVSSVAATVVHPVTLPPINNYFVSVRARDDVGNYSSFVVPTRILNRGTEDVILNPTGTSLQRFGQTLSGPDVRCGPDAGLGLGFGAGIGSLNSDEIDDLIIAAAGKTVIADGGVPLPDGGALAAGTSLANAGSVYVHYGRTGFSPPAGCVAPNCQEIVSYQSTSSAFFGLETALGNVDTVNTAAGSRLDLVVTATGYDANRGRVLMYFGNAATGLLDVTTFVEFRGQDYGSRLGGLAKVVPDVNGDGINELIISSRADPIAGANAGQGMVYMFFGRAQSAWSTLMASTDSVTGRRYVAVSATTADRVLQGPLPVDNTGSAGNLFASTRGVFSPLVDFTGDGRPDFVIAANKNNLNRAYLYSSAAVNAAVAPVPVPTLLVDELDKGNTGTATGFGTRVLGGFNILGSSLPDLIATQARLAGGSPSVGAACNVKIFADGTASGFGSTATVTITGSSLRQFGFWAEAADVNGDSLVDLMVGEGGSSSSAWVFFQRAGGTFDSNAGGGFWQASFAGPTVSRRGSSIAYGDFDNDGRVDIAIGDEVDAPGRVIVWH